MSLPIGQMRGNVLVPRRIDMGIENLLEELDTGRALRSAARGRAEPPSPGGADMSVGEKPCPACACVSPKIEGESVRGKELRGYRCPYDKCGVRNFRLGWNEFRSDKAFLSPIEIEGWRLSNG